MHCAAFVCAPDAENLTRQADARAAASASEIRVPAPSPSATLTGTVWPAFHFDPGTGEKNPRIRYSTTYCRLAVPVMPALSVAVHVTVWTPGLLVSIAPQPAVATPVSEHAASGRSAKVAGAAAGSSAQRVCATVPSGSFAEIVTPTVVRYQPFDPSAVAGLSVIVVTGAKSNASYAPMSKP